MELQELLDHVGRRAVIEGGSEQHLFLHRTGQEALGIVAELNTGYRTPDEVRTLLSRLTGKGVLLSMGCRFQDARGSPSGTGPSSGMAPR